MITKRSKSCCPGSEPKVHRFNRQYTKPEMKYSDYVKLLSYLSGNCSTKEYYKASSKLDKFKIIVEE